MGDTVLLHWITPAISDAEIEQLSSRNPELCFERSADGDLIVTPPAGSESGRRNALITAMLFLWNEAEGNGVVFDSSAGFRLPDTSLLSPDASWIQRSRWERLTLEEREAFAPICPDVVLELMSPSDRGARARERILAFRKNGAAIAVLVDPFERSLEINGVRQPWQTLELAFPGCVTSFTFDPRKLE